MASDTEASCISDPNFAVICSFFEKFAKICDITHPSFLELQEMLENSQEVAQPLVDLHVKLLRKARKSVSGERWEKALVKFCHTYSKSDAWEIERFGYSKSHLSVKLRLLKCLLEVQFDLNGRFKGAINRLNSEELRLQPIGRDKQGHAYWSQLDEDCNLRVYREDLDDESWEIVARDREELVKLISQLSSNEPANGDLEVLLNEDSNSLEIEKPITDTGQVVKSPASDEEVEDEAEFEEPETEDDDYFDDTDEEQGKPKGSSDVNPVVGANGSQPIVENNKSTSETGCEKVAADHPLKTPVQNCESDIVSKRGGDNDPELDLRTTELSNSRLQVPTDLSQPQSSVVQTENDSSNSNLNQSAQCIATDLRKPMGSFENQSPVNLGKEYQNTLTDINSKRPSENLNSSNEQHNMGEKVKSQSDLGQPLQKKMRVEEPSDEVGDAIEEPIMLVRGEGSGADCDTGNTGKSSDDSENTLKEDKSHQTDVNLRHGASDEKADDTLSNNCSKDSDPNESLAGSSIKLADDKCELMGFSSDHQNAKEASKKTEEVSQCTSISENVCAQSEPDGISIQRKVHLQEVDNINACTINLNTDSTQRNALDSNVDDTKSTSSVLLPPLPANGDKSRSSIGGAPLPATKRFLHLSTNTSPTTSSLDMPHASTECSSTVISPIKAAPKLWSIDNICAPPEKTVEPGLQINSTEDGSVCTDRKLKPLLGVQVFSKTSSPVKQRSSRWDVGKPDQGKTEVAEGDPIGVDVKTDKSTAEVGLQKLNVEDHSIVTNFEDDKAGKDHLHVESSPCSESNIESTSILEMEGGASDPQVNVDHIAQEEKTSSMDCSMAAAEDLGNKQIGVSAVNALPVTETEAVVLPVQPLQQRFFFGPGCVQFSPQVTDRNIYSDTKVVNRVVEDISPSQPMESIMKITSIDNLVDKTMTDPQISSECSPTCTEKIESDTKKEVTDITSVEAADFDELTTRTMSAVKESQVDHQETFDATDEDKSAKSTEDKTTDDESSIHAQHNNAPILIPSTIPVVEDATAVSSDLANQGKTSSDKLPVMETHVETTADSKVQSSVGPTPDQPQESVAEPLSAKETVKEHVMSGTSLPPLLLNNECDISKPHKVQLSSAGNEVKSFDEVMVEGAENIPTGIHANTASKFKPDNGMLLDETKAVIKETINTKKSEPYLCENTMDENQTVLASQSQLIEDLSSISASVLSKEIVSSDDHGLELDTSKHADPLKMQDLGEIQNSIINSSIQEICSPLKDPKTDMSMDVEQSLALVNTTSIADLSKGACDKQSSHQSLVTNNESNNKSCENSTSLDVTALADDHFVGSDTTKTDNLQIPIDSKSTENISINEQKEFTPVSSQGVETSQVSLATSLEHLESDMKDNNLTKRQVASQSTICSADILSDDLLNSSDVKNEAPDSEVGTEDKSLVLSSVDLPVVLKSAEKIEEKDCTFDSNSLPAQEVNKIEKETKAQDPPVANLKEEESKKDTVVEENIKGNATLLVKSETDVNNKNIPAINVVEGELKTKVEVKIHNELQKETSILGLSMDYNPEEPIPEFPGLRTKTVASLMEVNVDNIRAEDDESQQHDADPLADINDTNSMETIGQGASRAKSKRKRSSIDGSSPDIGKRSRHISSNSDEVETLSSGDVSIMKKGRGRPPKVKRDRRGGRVKTAAVDVDSSSEGVDAAAELGVDLICEESSVDSMPVVKSKKQPMKPKTTPTKTRKVLGLEIPIESEDAAAATSSAAPVRQSRRIAQIKIREEAERREIEEATRSVIEQEEKMEMYDKKKKKKHVSDDYTDGDEEDEEEDKVERKKKKKKKREKNWTRKDFNHSNPWRSSSGSSTSVEEEEDDQEQTDDEDQRTTVLKSDHEFSPESDLEDDGMNAQPLRRARTARKESAPEEPVDEAPCQKCGKSDHPEWVLLCDKCDAGWHCSCLRPVLFVIPEGDWYCPPCQHTTLIKSLIDQLKELDSSSKKRNNEELRKKRLAYVGISLDNVLPKQDGKEEVATDSESVHGSAQPQVSSESSSRSSGSSGDESEPVYQLRERRKTQVSYRFNEYDDLINSAIQDEIEAVKGAGNQGRGKDIANIIEAEQEERVEEKVQEETENVGNEKDAEFEPEGEEEEEEDGYIPPVSKSLGKKKHRKLNSLDISSEDDADSDEDFKGTSSDEEDEDYEEAESDDSDVIGHRRGGRGRLSGPIRRSARARTTRFDREFIDDDSNDSDKPVKPSRKGRQVWQDTSESEESDSTWGQRKKQKQKQQSSRTYAPKSTEKKKKKKKRATIGSDEEAFKGSKPKKPKIKFGGLDEGEEEVITARRTRGQKINYVELVGTDSEEEYVKPSKKLESEDEYVVNEEEEEMMDLEDELKESDNESVDDPFATEPDANAVPLPVLSMKTVSPGKEKSSKSSKSDKGQKKPKKQRKSESVKGMKQFTSDESGDEASELAQVLEETIEQFQPEIDEEELEKEAKRLKKEAKKLEKKELKKKGKKKKSDSELGETSVTSEPEAEFELEDTSPKRKGRGRGKAGLAKAAESAALSSPSVSASTVFPPAPAPGNSVISRMLQSQPVAPAPRSFTDAASAMGQKYFGERLPLGERPPLGDRLPLGGRGIPPTHRPPYLPRSRHPMPYRQPRSPGMPHFSGVRGPPVHPNLPGNPMYHTPHHPMDPSPSGGGPITISSPGGDGKTPHGTPPPQYARGGPPPLISRFTAEGLPSTNAGGPVRHPPPLFPTGASGNHLQTRAATPPGRTPGNFSPYHQPPNYHYGAYPSPGPMSSEDALPPAAYQGSGYPEVYGSSPLTASDGSNSKPVDEEGSGEFGGLVSYFSSQREDDLDA